MPPSSSLEDSPYSAEEITRWAEESITDEDIGYEQAEPAPPEDEISDETWNRKITDSLLHTVRQPYPLDRHFFTGSAVTVAMLKKQERSSDLHKLHVEEIRWLKSEVQRLETTVNHQWDIIEEQEARFEALATFVGFSSSSGSSSTSKFVSPVVDAVETQPENEAIDEKPGQRSTPLREISTQDALPTGSEHKGVAVVPGTSAEVAAAEMEAVTCTKEEKLAYEKRCRPYIRWLFHEMTGMNYKNGAMVVNEIGYEDYVTRLPIPTSTGKYIIPESGKEVHRPNLKDPDSPSSKAFMETFMERARSAVAKDIPTPLIKNVMKGFIKTRIAGQQRLDDPLIGAQRKVSESKSRRKERQKSDLVLRVKFWDDSPVTGLPRVNDVKKLLLDILTVPERVMLSDTIDSVVGPEEFTAYAQLKHDDVIGVCLFREIGWLPPNLLRLVIFYDQYCRRRSERDAKGGKWEAYRTASMPRCYWDRTEPLTLPGGLTPKDLKSLGKVDFVKKIESIADDFVETIVFEADERYECTPQQIGAQAPEDDHQGVEEYELDSEIDEQVVAVGKGKRKMGAALAGPSPKKGRSSK